MAFLSPRVFTFRSAQVLRISELIVLFDHIVVACKDPAWFVWVLCKASVPIVILASIVRISVWVYINGHQSLDSLHFP